MARLICRNNIRKTVFWLFFAVMLVSYSSEVNTEEIGQFSGWDWGFSLFYGQGFPNKDETLAEYTDHDTSDLSYDHLTSCSTLTAFMVKKQYRLGLGLLVQEWGDALPFNDNVPRGQLQMRATAGLISISRSFDCKHVRFRAEFGLGRGEIVLSRHFEHHGSYLDEQISTINVIEPGISLAFPALSRKIAPFAFEIVLSTPAYFFDHRITLTNYTSSAEYTDYYLDGRMVANIGLRLVLDHSSLTNMKKGR
ncbi:hypothetical protein JXQ70_18510 [bacterium]|nr:hypothetical protein [bacterium]